MPRFTLDFDGDDDTRITRLTNRLAEAIGRVPSHRGMRHPSRADLLRALLVVAENDGRVWAAVEREIRAEVARRNPSDEVKAVAKIAHHLGPTMDGPEAQDHLADRAALLDQIAGELYDDRGWASERLGQTALALEQLGAAAGGYEGLRPLLDLAGRLQVVRDALEPAALRAECPRCRQLIRVTADRDGVERHNTQSGSPCSTT